MNEIMHTPLDLEVSPGIRVRDLKSRTECADAMFRIELDMESIQAQIGRAEADPALAAPGWRTKAQSAIRWKKRIKAAIYNYAASLEALPPVTAKHKALIDTFKVELGADEFERIFAIAKMRYPDAFIRTEGEGA